MNERGFYLRIAEALSARQLTEQELKLYISEVLELVRKGIDGRVPFKMTGQDCSSRPFDTSINADAVRRSAGSPSARTLPVIFN